MEKNQSNGKLFIFSLALSILILLTNIVAQPTGLEIVGNVTETALSVAAAERVDDGGTITTLTLSILQQNPRWKAYIGNLTGALTLDDADGQSIFRWLLGAEDTTGEIYISRSNAVSWGDVSCDAGDLQTIINTEETALSFSATAADSINRTFNYTTHPTLTVGVTDLTGCRSTHTYVNSTAEDQGSASFPIMLITDTTNLIYASPINSGSQSYNNETFVDFQAIVPNNPSSTTTYYFYAEIGGA